MTRKSFLALFVLGAVAWMQPPLTAGPPRCATGRFVADGAEFPVFELDDGTIALAGRCPPTHATFAPAQRSGVPMRASWNACAGTTRLHLRGRMDTDCSAIHGVLLEGGLTRPFSAHRTPIDAAAVGVPGSVTSG
ncbi:MAG TPA: hypothetical protein VGR62_06510 [Candidatus Binatia bacterium]|jgi:hypothetical protein|nr:hypothetical protein [Candidatus Binatia bacterium]